MEINFRDIEETLDWVENNYDTLDIDSQFDRQRVSIKKRATRAEATAVAFVVLRECNFGGPIVVTMEPIHNKAKYKLLWVYSRILHCPILLRVTRVRAKGTKHG